MDIIDALLDFMTSNPELEWCTASVAETLGWLKTWNLDRITQIVHLSFYKDRVQNTVKWLEDT